MCVYLASGKRHSAPGEYFNGALLNLLNRRYEYVNKTRGGCRGCFICNFILVKPGLHIIVTIAQHACGRVLTMVLKLDCKYFL